MEIIPSVDLRQLVGLRILRMGANHFKRIVNSELKHPMIHVSLIYKDILLLYLFLHANAISILENSTNIFR